ncbi:trypsin-like peptidase domain-containing protein [Nocardia colli]|uniref:Trypsin-like peptidase domain-containing protein n=1 Tax=Nocardia colli TaxID=2545717 RepID=A0A5N0EGC0_9NOCA|nr:trypsin-like peptidase domain-containing protein [Nocardia colli]KAA8888372.1 trypsin-like peptidase domain-containing protein [Nocardia colli]
MNTIPLTVMTAAVVAVSVVAGPAHAEPGVMLGGGSGIILDDYELCTLTTIGRDGAGRLVGLTAGHCALIGDPIASEQDWGAGDVGRVVDVNDDLDYAVIEFDPAKVTPVRQIGGTTIAGLGTYPGQGGVVCENGRSTGFDCGIVWGHLGDRILNQTCSRPGDSGGPVTVDDLLVGMNNGRVVGVAGIDLNVECVTAANPVHSPAFTHSITDILRAIDAGGGPGSAFRPI